MLARLLRLMPVLGVWMAAAAWAQPGPVMARTLSARVVVVGEGPAEPAELRVHPDFPTLLSFESEVVPGSVGVDEPECVRMLGTEGRRVVLEPLRELAGGERVRLWMHYARGGAVKRATLVLVPHASEVDVQVRVVLPGKLARAVEPREPSELMKLLLSGEVELGERLISNQSHATFFAEGVAAKTFWGYRLGDQRVSAILVRNPEGAAPWEPRVTWLTSSSLSPKPVALPVRMLPPRLLPGASGWVLMDWPLDKETAGFRLEVREREAGRGFRLEREGR